MKSLKYDSENIDLSSYDIVSIAFNMPDASLSYPKGSELIILSSCLDFCKKGIVVAIYPQSDFMLFVKNTPESIQDVKNRVLEKLAEFEKSLV